MELPHRVTNRYDLSFMNRKTPGAINKGTVGGIWGAELLQEHCREV